MELFNIYEYFNICFKLIWLLIDLLIPTDMWNLLVGLHFVSIDN